MSLRQLPSVDALVAELPGSLPRLLLVEVARRALEESRSAILDGREADPRSLAAAMLEPILAERPTRVVNATGVLLHTNLGRAPLAREAVEAAGGSGGSYGNVELDLTTGERGGRAAYVRRLLSVCTGAEAAVAVNNNAAALFLALTALASGREVPVSRGELIEIGGSFRLPELMAASGARLIEVGTTNRTRLGDYRSRLSEATALLLKIHPSNFRIEGFTESVSVDSLAALAGEAGVPLVVDVGSGLLDAEVPWLPGPPPQWLGGEPGVRQTLEAGADLVLFSGDKLLGGPQAGIAVGRAELIRRMARHPVARAVRSDGASLAALAATLELYAGGEGARVPFWAMASLDYGGLEARAKTVLAEAALRGEVRAGSSVAGAGSVPGASIASPVLVLEVDDPDAAWRGLLRADPPVLARREEGSVILDLRTVAPEDDGHLVEALRTACRS